MRNILPDFCRATILEILSMKVGVFFYYRISQVIVAPLVNDMTVLLRRGAQYQIPSTD